jgi:8-oxo-dGTP diphosphatase
MPPDLDIGHLKTLDLHKAEPGWADTDPEGRKAYGGVIFDEKGRVLLIESNGHYLGYVWTFPKGKGNSGEHPVDTAVREVKEETGHDTAILGLVPKRFPSPTAGWGFSQFFVMRSKGQTAQPHWETAQTRWTTLHEAPTFISQTHTEGGRARDLAILNAAVEHFQKLQSEPGVNDQLQPGSER